MLTLVTCMCFERMAQAESVPSPRSTEHAKVSSTAVGTVDEPTAETEADGGIPDDPDLTSLGDAALEDLLLNSPEKIGSLSLGPTDAGALAFPVQMPQGERWKVINARQAWGTLETMDFIEAAIDEVHERFPDTPPLSVGDISKKRGGYFPPHMNHQNGRDVDLGYYYKDPSTRWFKTVYRSNLDVPRTWALLRALVTETDLELVYTDRFVIALVKAHAIEIGEDEAWLRQLFREPSPTHRRPIIRHEDGHRNHLHVRFHNPKAQRLGQRLLPLLEKHEILRNPMVFTDHVAKAGETLARIARRYRTTKRGIRFFNEMKNDQVVVGQSYKVPHEGHIEPVEDLFVVPPRILPPEPTGDPQSDGGPSSSSDADVER